MERMKVTSYIICSFIGKSHHKSNFFKIERHIERSHHFVKRLKKRYQGVTYVIQSQISQNRLQDLLSNPIVEVKSEQVKKETTSNFKHKRSY